MATSFPFVLPVDDASVRADVGKTGIMTVESGRKFSFELHRKKTTLGPIAIRQFWMDQRSVYPDRTRRGTNFGSLVDAFWAFCFGGFTVTDEGTQDTFILASLLPHVRSTGARRVVLDSVPRRKSGERKRLVSDLESLLASVRNGELSLVEFRDSTADALGPEVFGDDLLNRYKEMTHPFLAASREALWRKGATGLEESLTLWKDWMKSFGRRGGHAIEKQVLDILSYECRAALHRCYSQVWDHLIFHLQREFDLRRDEVVFHRFWHLDQLTGSDNPVARFHLFHGHVFALHPVGGLFLETPTGRALMGEWLAKPEETMPQYNRLLNGLNVTSHWYANHQQAIAEERRRRELDVSDMAALEEQEQERKSGRRNKKSRRDSK